MPVSRELTTDLARNLVALYSGLESRLIASIAAEVRTRPNPTETDKATAATKLRQGAQRLLARLDERAQDETLAGVATAWIRGGQAALTELASYPQDPAWWERRGVILKLFARLLGIIKRRDRRRRQRLTAELTRIRDILPGVDAVFALARSLAGYQTSTHLRIVRWTDDVYRRVVNDAGIVDVLAGTRTRLQAAQVTFDRFVSRGVTGFTDRSGRNWGLPAYVEMAVRAGTAQAAVQGHMDRLADAGIDLVIVSDAPQECHLCRPWEGEVLARVGGAGRRTVDNPLTGRTLTIDVKASIPVAVAAGLMHPNCRHSLSAYIPGVTVRPTHTADPAGDVARQRQRAIERHIRAWKHREVAALTDGAKVKASGKVKYWQAAMRQHLDRHDGLRRLPARERIGIAR